MRRLLKRRVGLLLSAGVLFILGVTWRGSDFGANRSPAGGGGCKRSGSGGGTTPLPTPTSGANSVCSRWNADRADLSEGTFTGNVKNCDPGDLTGPGRANTLKLINLYRWMAGLPAVTDNASMNKSAQACALLISANGELSHSPPSSWKCYTSGGAGAAASSNEATGRAVESIDMYIQDGGNEQTMGHRRWILSNGLSSVGIGSTNSMSCLQIVHGTGGGPTFTAFPGPGEFPVQAAQGYFIWTIQSDTIDLSNAQATVKDGGTEKSVYMLPLLARYGSGSAVGFMSPAGGSGWSPQAGHTYDVSVTGVSPPINYSVKMVSCGATSLNVKSTGLDQPASHEPTVVSVAWMQPAANAGFGPPGSIAVSGTAKDGSGGVQIEYRVADTPEQLAVQPWRLANGGFAATPDANHVWKNWILPPLGRYYQVRALYGGVLSSGQCIGPADFYSQCQQ